MRLPMFQLIDDAIVLLERRRDFYRECSYELQQMLEKTLRGEALLGVNSRVKGAMSLREKIIRKRIYLQYEDSYAVLDNLSDLVGLRAECRFLSEEEALFRRLRSACTLRHEDGSVSVPEHPNIRFRLDHPQPETQQNGLAIYRIDGRYHKNGVCTPFELQIKALVHVFWAEVEHQLIYKNNSYRLVDGFMKKLLYSTYTNLEQMDHHLQLIYDQTQSIEGPERYLRGIGMETLLAKMISDLFFRRMEQQLGFSLKLRDACDALARHLLARQAETDPDETFQRLYQRVAAAAAGPIQFEEALELDGAFRPEDPFLQALGGRLLREINSDYDWNMFFRMLFALEPGDNLADFTEFLSTFRAQFAEESLYLPLYTAWGRTRARDFREKTLALLGKLLAEHGEISMLSRDRALKIEAAISEACTLLAMGDEDMTEELLRKALRA